MAEKENRIPKKNELQEFHNFVLFTTDGGKVNIDVYFQEETLWLTQKAIAELFEKGRSTITGHLKKIFEEGELDENMVCREFRHTTQHGAIEGLEQTVKAKYYSLKAITAVGYRVNSQRAIEFRKWASEVLHEYINDVIHQAKKVNRNLIIKIIDPSFNGEIFPINFASNWGALSKLS